MTTPWLQNEWARKPALLNGWLSIPSPIVAEVMARQGWDTLTIDMQHGLADFQAVVSMLQALTITAAPSIVRVPWLEPGILMRVLDAGAVGVICPMVNSVDDAALLVRSTTYAPRGGRSFGPLRANMAYGAGYWKEADAGIVRFAMIETAEALDNLDAILQVEGLDAVYVGPSDLSLSLGCTPSFDDLEPRAQQAIEHILERAHARGLKAGIHCASARTARARATMGYDLVTSMSDMRLLQAGWQATLAEWGAPEGGERPAGAGY